MTSNLTTRIEQAEAGETRAMLEEAWVAVASVSTVTWAGMNAARFLRFLDAEAYLDAALMLVPEGAWWWVEAQPLVHGKFNAGCADERIATASTPTLAIAAAALKTKEQSDGLLD